MLVPLWHTGTKSIRFFCQSFLYDFVDIQLDKQADIQREEKNRQTKSLLNDYVDMQVDIQTERVNPL